MVAVNAGGHFCSTGPSAAALGYIHAFIKVPIAIIIKAIAALVAARPGHTLDGLALSTIGLDHSTFALAANLGAQGLVHSTIAVVVISITGVLLGWSLTDAGAPGETITPFSACLT